MQCVIWACHRGVLGTFCCVLLTVNCSSVQAIKTVHKFSREKSECTFCPLMLPHWADTAHYSGLHCMVVLDEDPGARSGKTLASSGDVRRIFPLSCHIAVCCSADAMVSAFDWMSGSPTTPAKWRRYNNTISIHTIPSGILHEDLMGNSLILNNYQVQSQNKKKHPSSIVLH